VEKVQREQTNTANVGITRVTAESKVESWRRLSLVPCLFLRVWGRVA
jgi:hypothetical protein